MKRRAFLMGGATSAALAALPVIAQPGAKRFRIGFLATTAEATAKPVVDAFVAGLADRGYRLGGNAILEIRYADGNPERLSGLARELIALKPDVLVGAEPAAVVLKQQTATIPIVLLVSTDPVAAGLVRSLARPGTNVTGLANRFEQIFVKHVELLREINPRLARAALVSYRARDDRVWEGVARAAAKTTGITVEFVSVADEEGLRRVFQQLEKQRPDALIIAPTPPALQLRKEIIAFAERMRLPAITSLPPSWSEAGGLLNYGANALADYRYAASFVDRILRGASPADIPVEQLHKFELIVNLKTARQIGVEIPRSILARADRLIE
jgi:putative tryptophan/tyrosine transport system substrate-binding protein